MGEARAPKSRGLTLQSLEGRNIVKVKVESGYLGTGNELSLHVLRSSLERKDACCAC